MGGVPAFALCFDFLILSFFSFLEKKFAKVDPNRRALFRFQAKFLQFNLYESRNNFFVALFPLLMVFYVKIFFFVLMQKKQKNQAESEGTTPFAAIPHAIRPLESVFLTVPQQVQYCFVYP